MQIQSQKKAQSGILIWKSWSLDTLARENECYTLSPVCFIRAKGNFIAFKKIEKDPFSRVTSDYARERNTRVSVGGELRRRRSSPFLPLRFLYDSVSTSTKIKLFKIHRNHWLKISSAPIESICSLDVIVHRQFLRKIFGFQKYK